MNKPTSQNKYLLIGGLRQKWDKLLGGFQVGSTEPKLKRVLNVERWPGGGLKEPKFGLRDLLWWPESPTKDGGGGLFCAQGNPFPCR
jgi:hypothetical protein